MSTFRYAAKGPGGQTVEGTIDAQTKNEAVEMLRQKNLVPVRVDESTKGKKGKKAKGAKGPSGAAAPRKPKGKARAKRQEVVMFTRQLATMVSSGLSLVESLEVLAEQAESPGMKVTCSTLINQVRGGMDLSSSMELCPKVFDELYVSMVKAGEVSGQMDLILERLADYQEDAESLRREIKSAMTYPVISMFLVTGITVFLMVGVVPGFKEVFEGLGAELPPLTLFVLAVSDWLQANLMLTFLGGIAIFVGLSLFRKTDPGRLMFDHLALRAPVFGPLTRKVVLARFSRTFSTLIRSGVPIMSTLDIVADTAGNKVVANVVHDARDSVRQGNQLSEPLGNSKVFPPMVVRMVAIGERSGALELLLEKIAVFYDAQVKAQVKALTSLIEPLLISFMGIIVGGVVLSVFLPILEVVGKLGGG